MRQNKFDSFKESIFEYDDYRVFLKDYFSNRKKLWKHFTQRYFAEKAGFSSHAFCNYVINGKRNLSSQSIAKFVTAMELKNHMADYFETLVYFNQEKDDRSKKIYFTKLENILKQREFYSISSEHSKFYSCWYFQVLRELVVESNWCGDYKKLAAMVFPSITSKEAKDAVKFMLEAKIILKDGNSYKYEEANINDEKIPQFVKKHARRELFARTVDVLDLVSPKERFAAYTTFSTSRKGYDRITELYAHFKQKAIEVVYSLEDDEADQEVFTMTYSLYPTSKLFQKKCKEKK